MKSSIFIAFDVLFISGRNKGSETFESNRWRANFPFHLRILHRAHHKTRRFWKERFQSAGITGGR